MSADRIDWDSVRNLRVIVENWGASVAAQLLGLPRFPLASACRHRKINYKGPHLGRVTEERRAEMVLAARRWMDDGMQPRFGAGRPKSSRDLLAKTGGLDPGVTVKPVTSVVDEESLRRAPRIVAPPMPDRWVKPGFVGDFSRDWAQRRAGGMEA